MLRAIFHGDLCPADRRMIRGSEGTRLTEELARTEDILYQSLTPDLAAILDRPTAAQAALDSLTAETCYIDGFRSGARVMMEILHDGLENAKPTTE